MGNEACVVEYVFRQLNLLSTATPAVGAWLVPIDQLKSSLEKLDMEATLRVCAVMGCIMTEALEVRLLNTDTVRCSFDLEHNVLQQNCALGLADNVKCVRVCVL